MKPHPDKVVSYNREKWDAQVNKANRWTVPVSTEEIDAARSGQFTIVLTPAKPVPRNWFPATLNGCDLLCLASGGGQQGPILAAAGANVTVFDNSPNQLAQDRAVADRDHLRLKTVQGDMANLSCFSSESFDFVFHPCSNCFAQDIRPVWKEAFRVLRPGGVMISGFCNPLKFIFDEAALDQGKFDIKYSIPYSDLTSLSAEEFERFAKEDEPACFGHTLEDQIGGQIDAGFAINGFYEDDWGPDSDDVISKHIKSFIATKATKPGSS